MIRLRNFLKIGNIPLIAGLASFLILLPFARIDFDRAHDGYMLAAVVALNQGLQIHSQVVAQYGFLVPMFQSIFTQGSDFPSLIVRIINIVVISSTVFLITNIGFLKNSELKISKVYSIVGATLWIILNDVFFWIPMHPWTTNFVNLFIFLVINLLLTYSYTKSKKTVFIKGIIVGFAVAALPFMRINVGGLASIIFIVFIGIEHLKLRRQKDSRFIIIFASISLTWLCFIIYFVVTDIYRDVIYQTVIWPLRWSQIASSWNNPIVGVGKIMFTNTIFLILYSLLAFAMFNVTRLKFKTFQKIQQYLFFILILVPPAFVLKYSSDNCWQFPCTLGGQVIFAEGKWPYNFISNYSLNFLYFIVSICFIVVLIYILYVLTILVKQIVFGKSASLMDFWEIRKYKLLFAFISIANFSQIYPVYDSRHLWWASPTCILALIVIFNKTDVGKKILIPTVLVIITIMIPSSLISGLGYLNMERVSAPAKGIANGILVVPGLKNVLQDDFDILEKIPQNASKLFYVNESYHAIYDRKYNSIDQFFSTNATESLKQRLSRDFDYLIIENYLISDNQVLFDEDLNLELFNRNDRITIFVNKQT
jgi:hypothetical protein